MISQSADAAAEQPSSGPTLRAGLAGTGGGTGLVAFAEAVPSESLRAILVYLAPLASVTFGVLAFYVELQARRYFQQRLVRRVRRTLETYLRNPHTSDEHKVVLRRRLEEIEEVVTLQEVERIKVLGVPRGETAGDYPGP